MRGTRYATAASCRTSLRARLRGRLASVAQHLPAPCAAEVSILLEVIDQAEHVGCCFLHRSQGSSDAPQRAADGATGRRPTGRFLG